MTLDMKTIINDKKMKYFVRLKLPESKNKRAKVATTLVWALTTALDHYKAIENWIPVCLEVSAFKLNCMKIEYQWKNVESILYKKVYDIALLIQFYKMGFNDRKVSNHRLTMLINLYLVMFLFSWITYLLKQLFILFILRQSAA